MGDSAPPVTGWGIDHHRSPVGLRERVAVAAADPVALAAELRQLPGAGECVVVSTCNRLEIYLGGVVERRHIESALAGRAGVDAPELARHAYASDGEACATHLFRVAAGLESMVLGEAEIAGQVRRSYDAARGAGLCGAILHGLFQRAMACGKDVRTRTGLGDHKLSVASVAVDLARQVHGDLATARLLLVGAGETAELAARYLASAGVRTISVVNRSAERAAQLAEKVSGSALAWDRLADALVAHDVVVSSTAAPHPVIGVAMVRAALRQRRSPLTLIDLAVPRDVEPEVGQLDDAFLFNVDHLERVVAQNLGSRQGEVAAAEALVAEAVAAWKVAGDAAQAELMAQVARYFKDVVAAEEARLAAKLPGVDRGELRYGLERVGSKLLHPVLAYLRNHADDALAQRAVAEMLGLDRAGQRPDGDGRP
ncbi:MAG: glutamyl-tRNA reductase [Planctomycetes bacterium]|nr:glutamyl-tRNA reductase [Planctomycetota bacterium]